MRVIAQVTAIVILHEEVEIEISDDATEQEICDAILEEAPNTFSELISLSNGLEPNYEIDSFEEE